VPGIERLLGACRDAGFASEVEENELGAACVAAPVRDVDGRPVAAVSVAGPLSRMGAKRRDEVGRLLVTRLAEVEREMAARMPGTVA
jgi:IclR family acetate operon transcriptional repressor